MSCLWAYWREGWFPCRVGWVSWDGGFSAGADLLVSEAMSQDLMD